MVRKYGANSVINFLCFYFFPMQNCPIFQSVVVLTLCHDFSKPVGVLFDSHLCISAKYSGRSFLQFFVTSEKIYAVKANLSFY